MATTVQQRPGKYKFRVEVDWNDYDPWDCYDWCKQNIEIRNNWFKKDIFHAEYDWTFYFYFVQSRDATAFVLRWS